MSIKSYAGIVTVSAAGLALPAHAAGEPAINITGFGTAALTMADTRDAEFIRPNQAAGVKRSPRTGVDSNFGIQATATFNDDVSFIAQGLVSKAATDAYGAELTWAFLKYRLSDQLTLRLGRTTPPTYMISDFRHVGYANVMIRPPGDVYRQVTVGSLDGAELVYQHDLGGATLTAQLGTGKGTRTVPGGAYVDFKRMTTLQVVLENGPFTVRYGHVDALFSFRNNALLTTLLGALRGAGQAGVAEALDPYDVRGKFDSLGVGIDDRNVVVQAEYAKKKTGSRVVPATTSWYAMAGYRIGKFTPYYMRTAAMQDDPRSFPELPAAGPLAGLAAGANRVAKTAQQRSQAIGVRWDFARSAAFKLQADRITPVDGAGGFINANTQFSGPVTVYAAGIDFVF